MEEKVQMPEERPLLAGKVPGHVVEVKKHRFKVMFRSEDGTVWQLEVKRRKLNDLQRELLKVDAEVQLDFDTHKLSFKTKENSYC